MNEHDVVVLTNDLAEHGLAKGDIGTIIHIYGDGSEFEVEVATLTGETVAIVTLPSSSVRPATSRDIMHARAVA